MADDRTSPAKLRDAAVELIAEGGTRAATVRAVAERAGLTQGLIRHHFGSLAGLIEACDAHAADVIKDAKRDAIATPGAAMDPLRTLRDPRHPYLMGYLAHRLREDAPGVNALVDQFVDDAMGYLAEARDAGLVTAGSAERRAVVLTTVYALGSIALHHQLKRLMNIDLTAPDLAQEPGITDYLVANMEVFGGLFTDETQQAVVTALAAATNPQENP